MTGDDAVSLEPLGPRDAEALSLLQGAGLPTDDLDGRQWLLGARRAGRLVGVIGLEPTGELGLVRSMVVAGDQRRAGLATRLHDAALAEARRRGLTHAYALTETAAFFFTRRGYSEVPREQVPPAVRQTAEFSHLCPASAQVFARPL